MRWVIERGVFASGFDLGDAARAAGHAVSTWDDAWWTDGLPAWSGPTLFHGSLGNAARIAREAPWRPGAFCDAAALACSAWYPRAGRWLLNEAWQVLPASRLVADPPLLERMFVRPDSPLKPFAGRVVERAKLSLRALDHGFYYDDADLPVVVAPVRDVGAEWRYVVVDRRVVAGSGYDPVGRRPRSDTPDAASWRYAEAVAADLEPPEPVYVLDICAFEGGFRLVELNPFSGADLYACDPAAVVRAVAQRVG